MSANTTLCCTCTRMWKPRSRSSSNPTPDPGHMCHPKGALLGALRFLGRRRQRWHARYTHAPLPVPRPADLMDQGLGRWLHRKSACRPRPCGARNLQPHAPVHDQAVRFQVVRRPDHVAPAHQHDRHRRPQWLRQVQHHRCGALGDGRELGQPPTWRFVDRRDLFRLFGTQAGVAGDGGADLRQLRPHHQWRVRLVQRDFGQAPGQSRRQ